MKRSIQYAAILLLAVLLPGIFSACKAPAPNGMYAPSDSEEYRQGVEDIVFALPENYTVTMSANVLAGKGEEGDSFSIQCRHSDYVYKDLKENYKELKTQLVALYGEYEETLTEELTVAEQNALEARYDLTIAGEEYSYIQYLFYRGKKFYLFTYTTGRGKADEALLSGVLASVSFEKEGYTAPEGYKTVENATVDAIANDRYLLYCPDEWVLDTSLGMVCMRVPSSSILSNISFAEIAVGKDFDGFLSDYAEKYAPDAALGAGSTLEKYILATTFRMFGTLKDFTVLPNGAEEKITAENLLEHKDSVIQKGENAAKLTYSYVDFTASLSASGAHGSGSLFLDYEKDDDEKQTLETYKFRQYYIYADGYIYLFTYTATAERFEEQLSDASKVVKNFELVKEA